jgi:hypothetical protein
MNNEKVENYAKSLVKHGLYATIDEARIESIRWHEKAEFGLVEPLQCPYHPDIEITVTHAENGGVFVEYKLPKK